MRDVHLRLRNLQTFYDASGGGVTDITKNSILVTFMSTVDPSTQDADCPTVFFQSRLTFQDS